ncbi:hypothetical protein NDU88_005737 [Pleurodeles waltl]|uniref:Uncharacterized protein n=1 Tax=Pleurodeles waltl TaxID=8319 RepID=A0AAV7RL16_PLEWA|nr:hypothetical protein NDU88_005737 [Pleurodeles waltl]
MRAAPQHHMDLTGWRHGGCSLFVRLPLYSPRPRDYNTKICPKSKRMESGRRGDPSDRFTMRPGAREFLLWAPNQ